jgi:hypothetical protein
MFRLRLTAIAIFTAVTTVCSPLPARADTPTVSFHASALVETCSDVVGPKECIYEQLQLTSTDDPDIVTVCLYRAFYSPGEFPDEYEQACLPVSSSRFEIDEKNWTFVRLLPTAFTFEGQTDPVLVSASFESTTEPWGTKGHSQGVDGQCTNLQTGGGQIMSAAAVITVGADSHGARGAGLTTGWLVDISHCHQGQSSATAPRTEGTYADIVVSTCQDVAEDQPCIYYAVSIFDLDPESPQVCVFLDTYASPRSSPSSEFGCVTVPSDTIAVDRKRLTTGELPPLTIQTVDDDGLVRDVTVSLSFTGTGELSYWRARDQTDLRTCKARNNYTNASRSVDAIVTVDGVAYPSYSGYVLLTGFYEGPSTCDDDASS